MFIGPDEIEEKRKVSFDNEVESLIKIVKANLEIGRTSFVGAFFGQRWVGIVSHSSEAIEKVRLLLEADGWRVNMFYGNNNNFPTVCFSLSKPPEVIVFK